jgi:phosphoribosylaminoimidazolecarboxamide formyltransferase/IMP cyclohydrolase
VGPIENVLVSVANKSGLDDLARQLSAMGISILATSGTGEYLRQKGVDHVDISTLTGKVEYLGGLVKTLHPAIHAGILARRDDRGHMAELDSAGWRKIDMVVVNFYPLGGDREERDLAFIDIGGPSMARAAAKNYKACVPVPHPSWYDRIIGEIQSTGDVNDDLRWELATDTLLRTGTYDAKTLGLVSPQTSVQIGADSILLGLEKTLDLRYGENPHQKAAFYTAAGRLQIEILKGELSYNNMLDLDCCLNQLTEFEGSAAVVVKHVGPCGVAEAEVGSEALENAYACDPLSAFGGVIGVNFPFTQECSRILAKKFVECIVAPDYEDAALEGLMKKKRTRVVKVPAFGPKAYTLRSSVCGVLAQSYDDRLVIENLDFADGEPPNDSVVGDLMFAWKVVKHVKSNAVIFARDKRTLGIGTGQPSRVDATKIAIRKAAEEGHDLKGSVMASDGFFPFPDSVQLAAEAGARAVIQPGGSIRDGEVIEAAGAAGITMVLTGTRHFRH